MPDTGSLRFWFFAIVAVAMYVLYLVITARIHDDNEKRNAKLHTED